MRYVKGASGKVYKVTSASVTSVGFVNERTLRASKVSHNVGLIGNYCPTEVKGTKCSMQCEECLLLNGILEVPSPHTMKAIVYCYASGSTVCYDGVTGVSYLSDGRVVIGHKAYNADAMIVQVPAAGYRVRVVCGEDLDWAL